MDKVGPEFFVNVGLMLVAVIAACVVYDFRHEIWTLLSALRRRYLRGPSFHDLVETIADDAPMSSADAYDDALNSDAVAPITAISPEKRNGETAETGVATGKNEGNDPFHFPDLFTGLARLVLAQKVSETDAIKLAVKSSPGKSPRYIEARDRLHAAIAVERKDTQYRPLDADKRPVAPPAPVREDPITA